MMTKSGGHVVSFKISCRVSLTMTAWIGSAGEKKNVTFLILTKLRSSRERLQSYVLRRRGMRRNPRPEIAISSCSGSLGCQGGSRGVASVCHC
jgi:hypothetical protein